MQFLSALEVGVVIKEFALVQVQLHIVVFIWREDRRVKLILSPEQLNIQKFIDQVANYFTVAKVQMFRFTVLGHLHAEFLQVVDHFLEGFTDLAFEVFEVDEYAEFSRLFFVKRH